jgi:Cof subfamily protein (haloacid dehalogenase superfamily)
LSNPSSGAQPKSPFGDDVGRTIWLLISDIDGTLVNPDKILTPAAVSAVRRLAAADVGFTLVSSRPPRGIERLLADLDIRLPFAAFNGGSLVEPNLTLIESHHLVPDIARSILALLEARRVDVWVFADGDWLLRDPGGSQVPREKMTLGFEPKVVERFDDVIDRIDKITGMSDDFARLASVEAEARAMVGSAATIIRSQPYYLDVTDPSANKGHAVTALCARIGVDPSRTAVIGDMFNDMAMFEKGGFSIAMGQAPEAVRARADAVTLSDLSEGFANAVDRFILPRADRPGRQMGAQGTAGAVSDAASP